MLGAFSRLLKYELPMMQGDDVQNVQEALALQGVLHASGADGLFGPGTKSAVEAFQRQHGLGVDGIVGRNTHDTLATLVGGGSAGSGGGGGRAGSEPVTPVAGLEGRAVPADWMPAASMKRIILHWTGGAYDPSGVDKKHYHLLIDGDGQLHRGNHPITANVPPLSSGGYAAHTKSCNSHSIGLSLCSMGGDARENPFRPGPFPITRAQWAVMDQVVAELCLRYGIEVSRETVLGHGEVQANLGITQNGKWDPMAVEWDPGRPYREVGDGIRARVAGILDALKHPTAVIIDADAETEVVPTETVTVDGEPLRGAAFDGRIWLDLNHLVTHFGWDAPVIDEKDGVAMISDPALRFAIVRTTGADGFDLTWVEVAEVSERLGLILREDARGDLHLETPSDAPEKVIVKRGQTLSQIAQLHLGDANRWTELRMEDGTPFDEESAKRLKVGAVVLLPAGQDAAKRAAASPGTRLKVDEIAQIAERIAKLEGGGATMRKTRAGAVDAILRACVENKVNDLSHQAYILATAYHETNLGQFMKELWGPTAIQKTYGHRLGNRGPAEGKLFMGRGFVQITGRNNYQKYSDIFRQDFVGNPDLVADPKIAAQILVRGMAEFGFTGKGLLSDMGLDGDFDWFNARSLINGDKNKGGDQRYPGQTKGHGIADKGRAYRQIIAMI
ncbi:peptidoglycan-binding protein [uncultured Tateyamaria sp.]|uniref:peptidoglycan-binding protein n=1 Tax=uncultured Tateyamaria sp. TaxID=455651 RepID=UPI00261DA399|nr:peptidoglycan-binding protein [uncultured Tateyamaria sp.]